MTELGRGVGVLADPNGPHEEWGGRRAQQYVAATLERYGTVCWLCGLAGSNSADHIIAIANGGAVYDLDNLGPSHRRCNYARGKRDVAIDKWPIESAVAFFSSRLADTHAQPLPFSPEGDQKNLMSAGVSER